MVLGELESGGMGTVWLAHIQGYPDQLLALKRMHKHLAKEGEFVNMFLDEIWLTGALHHPNVVGLVGWGIDREGPYFATDFVLGDSLSGVRKKGASANEPLPQELVAFLAAKVARGLDAAFTLLGDDGQPLEIVHRDLTPSNVLIGLDGSVRISDFGVAKAARKIVKTATGILKGKLHYMSPEYVLGEELDVRSDLYSVGVLMFELVTGHRPFNEEGDYQLLHKVATEDQPPVADHAEIDAALGATVDRLRSRKPDDRFVSAAALAEWLEAWLSDRGHALEDCEQSLSAYVTKHCHGCLERVASIRDEAQHHSVETLTADHAASTTRTRRPASLSDSARPTRPRQSFAKEAQPTRRTRPVQLAPALHGTMPAPDSNNDQLGSGGRRTSPSLLIGLAAVAAALGIIVVAYSIVAPPAPEPVASPERVERPADKGVEDTADKGSDEAANPSPVEQPERRVAEDTERADPPREPISKDSEAAQASPAKPTTPTRISTATPPPKAAPDCGPNGFDQHTPRCES